jgi:hypothetical protein
MARAGRLWIPVLVGLLVAGVSGVGSGRAVAAVEPRVTTVSIMIPASAFIPNRDDCDYDNGGYRLQVTSGTCGFYLPLSFPVPVVNIKRITLYAYDNDPLNQVCVKLYRARPADADRDNTGGSLCTSDDAVAPQAPYQTAFNPRRVATAFQAAYLWAGLYGPTVAFYGVKVTYSY